MIKILFVGDVVGKPGRAALRQVLPQWQEKYRPDVTIVNVENMAHGKGVTINTMREIEGLGIDVYTSGNHVFDKGDLSKECFGKYPNLIRPANFEGNLPGHGYYRFSKELPLPPSWEKEGELQSSAPLQKGKKLGIYHQQFLVLNLNATVFMENQFNGDISNAFLALDRLLTDQAQKGDIIIVDFHSEATSEKIAFGFYADGRVTAVFGTHTHVPTADARILPSGTAYISDVGMTGALNSVLGVKKENALKKFLDPTVKFKNEPEEEGVAQVNGVIAEAGSDGKAAKIEKLYQES